MKSAGRELAKVSTHKIGRFMAAPGLEVCFVA